MSMVCVHSRLECSRLAGKAPALSAGGQVGSFHPLPAVNSTCKNVTAHGSECLFSITHLFHSLLFSFFISPFQPHNPQS